MTENAAGSNMPQSDMEGRCALITGAGAGIGRASALRLARHGTSVVAVDWDEERARAVSAEIEAEGGRALAVQADVTDEARWGEVAAEATDAFGGIDVLFNNAGGGSGKDGTVVDMDLDEFWRAIRVDLFGTLLGCRAVIPRMVERGGGSIINISSLRAVVGTRGQDAYTAAKGGVLAMSRAMAVEWADRGIRVNVLAPGVVKTDRVLALIKPDNPIYKMMLTGPVEVEAVANLVYYLASDQSLGMTGSVLRLDGGASAQ